jgi:hypothetical protein
MPAERRPVRDREVVLVAIIVVLGVIAFARVTGLITGLGDFVSSEPAVIVLLVAVTALVLVSALRPRR